MEDCKSIMKLPRNISMLTSLETLIISGCSNLSMFSLDMREMESLKVFEADGVPIHRLLTAAEEVTLCPRPNVEISRASYLPCNLVDLRLNNCNLSNDDFPRELGSLSSLKILDLGRNPICSLPDCVRGITGLDSLSFYNCTRLKSLVRLPTVGNLSILGCKALEKVTFQSFSQVNSRMRSVRYTGIHNVDEVLEYEYWYKIEPIEKVDIEMINLLGLGNLKYSTESLVMSQYLRLAFGWRAVRRPIQGLQECGIFSTFLPGNEVPQYGLFSHKSKGALISFTVPVLPNRRFRGLNIFSVYAKSISNESPNINASLESLHCAIFTKVSNKSKGLEWIYGPSLFGAPGDGQDVIWLSHWKFRNDLEGGDEVTVSVMTISEFQVKECGIQIVYYEQEDMMLSTQDNTTDDFFYPVVIGGDLSRFLRSGSGTYLLRHGLNWLTEEEKDCVFSSVLFQDDIGDHNKLTDVGRW